MLLFGGLRGDRICRCQQTERRRAVERRVSQLGRQPAGKESPDGGCFSELWKAVTAYGVCPETEMPYQEYFESTKRPSREAMAQAEKLRDLGLRLHWIKEWDPNKGLERPATRRDQADARAALAGGRRLSLAEARHAKWEDGMLKMARATKSGRP